MVDGVPLARLLEEYERQCALSNEIVAAHTLDDVGKHSDFRAASANLRWILMANICHELTRPRVSFGPGIWHTITPVATWGLGEAPSTAMPPERAD